MTQNNIDRRSLLVAAGGAAVAAPLHAQVGRSALGAGERLVAGPKPKVRAITAFVTIDPSSYESDVGKAVSFLTMMKRAIVSSGFDVMTTRLVTQPFPDYTHHLPRPDAARLLEGLDRIAKQQGVALNIGPVCQPGQRSDVAVDLLVDNLGRPGNATSANIIVADERGINWELVGIAGRIIERLGKATSNPQANFNFAALAMMKPFGPFFPGAWHDGRVTNCFSIGLEGANVAADVFRRRPAFDVAAAELADALSIEAQAIEAAAVRSAGTWRYAGIDPTPAPLGAISIGAAIESLIDAPFGSPGTETACAIITSAVKAVKVRQVGYAGLMLPVLEDEVLARRWSEGRFTVDSILAYSAVCASGLDTIPLPGATSPSVLAKIIGDVATLAYKWNKPLAARLLPAVGQRAGEIAAFGGMMGAARIQPFSGDTRTF